MRIKNGYKLNITSHYIFYENDRLYEKVTLNLYFDNLLTFILALMYFYHRNDRYRDIQEKLFWSTISACYSVAKF